jgi:hypothetical protein
VPRLSSPLNAKASVRSPYALDRSQQNSCVGTVWFQPYERAGTRPHMRFVLMSSQASPPSLRGDRANPSIHNVIRRSGRNLNGNLFPRSLSAASGGARRDRTDDLMLAKHALYQLSYGPYLKPRPLGALSPTCPPEDHTKCGGPRQTRTADLTLIRRVL